MTNEITFENLPEWMRLAIMRIRPRDYATWIHDPVPALDNRSVAEMVRLGPDGEKEVREYVDRVIGKFFD